MENNTTGKRIQIKYRKHDLLGVVQMSNVNVKAVFLLKHFHTEAILKLTKFVKIYLT